MIFTVPVLEKEPWPTLGPQVCDFIEANLVFGPGDLRGEPARLDAEKRALIYRMYEVYPKGHPQEGRRRFKRVCLSLRKGSAKALALDTPVPLTSGWTTMGNIKVGDRLFDERGIPCSVITVSEVYTGHKCYEVIFRDGNRIVADAGHLWYTEELPKGNHQQGDLYQGGVKTTEDIALSLVRPGDGACNHRIPVAGPLALPLRKLPIDPWILGAWLGDGRTDDAEFTMHIEDYPHFLHRVARAGYFTSAPKPDTRRPSTIAVRVSTEPVVLGAHKTTLVGVLRTQGLLGNKHVPAMYLRAGIEQRWALLQGLMDTDGTVSSDGVACSFTSTLHCLAEAVYELAATLGLKPSLNETFSPGAPAWRVYFHASADSWVFSLPRKVARLRHRPKRTPMSTNRHIIAVNPVDSVPTRCIMVDSLSQLYLAGRGMIPTHNTELGAWIAAAELHHEGPVRCVGWDKKGNPIGGPVTDPYIPMVACTEEQTEELGYGALKAILEESPIARDFDIGMERIVRRQGDGKAVGLTSAPNARDGARTTMQFFDETHRFVQPKLRKVHQTMMANIPKRRQADAWSLETTTAFAPGEGSIAESTWEYAKAVAEGLVADPRLFFFHRQAADSIDIGTPEGLRAAIIEASGPVAEWSDIESILEQFNDPTSDKSYLERMWLNRLVRASDRAFDAMRWAELAKPHVVPDGELITLGFDGARFEDATGIVATHIESGYQWVLGVWEHPYGIKEWEVPAYEVERIIAGAFQRWEVWRMYADPPYWETHVAKWAGEYGEKRIIEWRTSRTTQTAYAVKAFNNAIQSGELSHDGNPRYAAHIGSAYRRMLNLKDDQGQPLFVIYKERSDSPQKIDLAMAGILSWEARNDALAAGVSGRSVYEDRGILVL